MTGTIGMLPRAIAALIFIASMPNLPNATQTDGLRRGRAALTHHVGKTPLKDCTRFNGRGGYYGNPWCTAEEQERWDRWDARRFKRR